jgi:hypothetical protein
MKKFFKTVFDKHHGIERFGLSFLVLLIIFCSITGSLIVTSYKVNHQALTSKAVYTTDFTMSRSSVKGTVEGVFTNQDKTKALLLLKFDDISKLSVDANNYTVFLRGYDQNKDDIQSLKSNPSGAIYMFGTSGYMGIYFVDTAGFENQIWYLTLRNDKELTNVSSEDVDIDEDSGESSQYAEYDLANIYFNPAASEATIVSCLDNDVVTVRDMYEECIARADETEIREALTSDLKDMRADIATILEYEQRLEAYGIALNDTYSCIAGDYIVNQDGAIVASMDQTVAIESYKESDTLYLKSNHTLSGGVDFNWQDGTIFDGYLTSLAGAQTVESYIETITNPTYQDDKTISKTWYYKSSGKEFTISSSSGFTQEASDINSAIQGLESTWESYYVHKQNYETKDLVSLLELDYQIMNVESNYTVNNSENMLRITK